MSTTPRSPVAPLIVSFEVHGHPTAKGNMMRFRTGYVDVTHGLAEWMTAIAMAANRERAKLGRPLAGPLHLDATFRLHMPAARPAAARRAGVWPSTVRPDADKLLRALFDGLTRSGLIVDDARIATGAFAKYEVTGWTGCSLDLWEVGAMHNQGGPTC